MGLMNNAELIINNEKFKNHLFISQLSIINYQLSIINYQLSIKKYKL